MRAASLPVPGVRLGDYPERSEPAGTTPKAWQRLAGRLPAARWPGALWRDAGRVQAQAQAWQALDDAQFAAVRDTVQARLLRDGLAGAALREACACAAEAARRATGRQAWRTQAMAALALLQGQMAEMATGEGKTLAAALAAGVGALAGIPVHVLTANDYLVQRDAEAYAGYYRLLGVEVACVLASDAPPVRREAYARPVVYATAREVAFDYLRDRLMHGTGRSTLERRASALADGSASPLLRGLCMAVIDEADSVLVDEAQMRLLLSRPVDGATARAFLWQAHTLAGRLRRDADFRVVGLPERIELTAAGRARVADLAAPLGSLWLNARHRDETVATALTARHLLHRDRDYVVCLPAEGAAPQPGDTVLAAGTRPPHGAQAQIAIVDRFTGRIAQGRQWSRGLHGLVALKEGCPLPPQTETLSQITFQRFFRRYHRVGGMSGTLREARAELRTLYGCAFVRVPLRLPDRGLAGPLRCWPSDAARCQAAVLRAAALAAAGRPVLLGCDSVEAGEALAAALRQRGLAHHVLHARLDAEEAATIAAAGTRGRITVATSMAGRGTDILVDPDALAAGGLHVLSCQHNASRRHDRQLAGRAARHGEPGSHEHWLACDAPGLAPGLAALLRVAARLLPARPDGSLRLPGWALHLALRVAQHRTETRHARQRWRLFQQDAELQVGLGFAGSNE